MTAATRASVLARLRTDLIGPYSIDERLNSRPSDVWLTGILWPQNTELAPEEDERLALASGADGDADADDSVRPGSVRVRRPAAAGLSFAARAHGDGPPQIDVTIGFGLYEPVRKDGAGTVWLRRQVDARIGGISLREEPQNIPVDVANVAGVRLHVRSRRFAGGVLATVTLINGSAPEEASREETERLTLFQVKLVVEPAADGRLIARPSRRAVIDEDDESADLLYRDACEYATGHTASAEWTIEGHAEGANVTNVRIAWIPDALTPPVSGDGHEVFERLAEGGRDPLSARWLADADATSVAAGLLALCDAYQRWIAIQQEDARHLTERHRRTAARHIAAAQDVLVRMRAGVDWLEYAPANLQAFRLANAAMDLQRVWTGKGSLRWRPFQLGFLLLTIQSTADGNHDDRGVMDLLWFPTGGGKTEAYLGLIAFTAFHRRLVRALPDGGAGVAAVMRYTLRLLTTQQFARAAAMMLACELIRQARVPAPEHGALGSVPFSIGLWVGGDATPNTRSSAFLSQTDTQLASPRQLTDCPACHGRLTYVQNRPEDPVLVRCGAADCVAANMTLPVWTVDEDIYDRRPTLVIGTVDKFAQIVRKKETASLFGVGTSAQPQLILQDELHLIAGPLGTLAGLYEAALDIILSADGTPPKVIGSTATIRRAADQVLALFDRDTCQFPPPGLDAEDSGFAVVDTSPEAPGRLFAGVTTSGRSAKFTLQAVMASLLQTGLAGLSEAERDPYWTLLAYFNSLRELGGALVLTQDDVFSSLRQLAERRGGEPRRVPTLVEELTSRRTQEEIRDMLDRLAIPAGRDDTLDIVLATNMVSVGVDIGRLGLMVMNGQPKTMAEYIQATSRVGRGSIAGLVVTILNSAKPRDRSHYETFASWHSTLYRNVEATSVTPFASRARDRALHAVLVAVVRHTIAAARERPVMTDDVIDGARALIRQIARRAARIDPLETAVQAELEDRLARWLRRMPPHYWWMRRPSDSLLQGAEEAAAKRAAGRAIGQAWPTPNTMRAVEPASPYRLVERLRSYQ